MHEIGRRERRASCIGETDGAQTSASLVGDPLPQAPDPFLLRVDRQDLPAAAEQLGGLESLTAPEVDGHARRRPSASNDREDLEQQVARLSVALSVVVPDPVAALGHPQVGTTR